MTNTPDIQPLPYKRRRYTFRFLLLLFVAVLPFLYLYATGYRFDFSKEASIIKTGGMYIAAEKTGASIYVDETLVKETRTFRKAFYAQGLYPGTHRVHVQKPGHQTWVKELPVEAHIVTEGQAFNLPIISDVRIISPWKDASGVSVLFATSTLQASTTNNIRVASTTATTSLIADTEFASLQLLFASSSATTTDSDTIAEKVADQIDSIFTASTTPITATTTKTWRNVRLFESNGNVYGSWIGLREDMPYYYCAEAFELLSTSTEQALQLQASTVDILHPVQVLPPDVACDPTIELDRRGERFTSFDFYPGSTDLVLLALESGVYVIEIDNRAWQNVQPLVMGTGLDMRVENGNVYVYDGDLIYHVLIEN